MLDSRDLDLLLQALKDERCRRRLIGRLRPMLVDWRKQGLCMPLIPGPVRRRQHLRHTLKTT